MTQREGVANLEEGLLKAELLHELFEERADARPQSVALACGAAQMSYGELEQRANQLAHWLRRQGVGRGDRMGLWLPRSMEIPVAFLGILKAGAAYVPMDAEFPAERVSFVLGDCQARAVVTTRALAAGLRGFAGTVIAVDAEVAEIAAESGERPENIGVKPSDLCYVIYTSGTTGKPKGVEIEHRSVCHLVRAEGEIFQVRPEDRVFQGFSVAFDASVEEFWLAFFAGATLVIGTLEMVRAGAALGGMLDAAGVTVLSCVPTLLAMMEGDATRVRLLILGGEACPPDLVKRWWKPSRRVVNTYGPTEATVIATFAECSPDKPVTLGKAVPNYLAVILDEKLTPVVGDIAGELCLGGVGLARGYAGRPELTREKFIDWTHNGTPTQRLYRTGDLARWTAGGEIEFLGRIDTQVKIRGYRVELAEIEAALIECPGVKAAAALREEVEGAPLLVGYVVARTGETLDAEKIRGLLRMRLPAYMVPALLETLTELPLLPSGKVDRKNLPAPRARLAETSREIIAPRTPLEKQIAAVWGKLFAPAMVSVTDDFFLGLGGHSLLAARMVSELRRQAGLEEISMLDVYQHPTIERLAAEFEKRRRPAETAAAKEEYQAVPFWRHFICGAAQLFSLVFILTFFALQWLMPYLTYTLMVDADYNTLPSVLAALGSLILFYPVLVVLPIVVKWIVIGRYKPGSYPLWGWFYFRWWFAATIEAAVPVGYLSGTPIYNMYLRLMGAKIGKNVHIDCDAFAIYDLLSIGDDATINVDCNLLGYTVENGMLKIGRITIGERCFVGTRSALRENTVMENGAALEDLSLLPRGRTIPRGETWLGSPARRVSGLVENTKPVERASTARRFGFGVLHGLGALTFPALVAAAIFPGIMMMNYLNYQDDYYSYLTTAPLVSLSFIVLLALEIVCVKWLLLGKEKPGTHRLHTWQYFRRWLFNQTMDLSLDVMGPLYASIYLAPWYKMLGAKLGKDAEVSTASYISPDLLQIDEGSFIADSVSLGAPRARDGVVTTGVNYVGKRSFIGNSAMLPPGTVIGDNVLIGCLSAPPPNPVDALREESTWLGSPAIFLPQRQKSAAFSEETTFRPSAKLRAQRAAIELLRVLLPSICFIVLISLLFSGVLLMKDYFDPDNDNLPSWVSDDVQDWFGDHLTLVSLMCFPILYIGCGLVAALATIVAKWVLVWRYRPSEKPLWSTAVWKNELINALNEHVAEPFLIGALTGTPFVCWYFRLLGAKIGKRVYMETTDFSEFDLVDIGDEATLNADCTVQTHLFEDRVMKMDVVKIGRRCNVGAGTLALYDTVMEDGAALGDLSLLMKGEVLPAGSKWQGIPAQRMP
jgi:non-ribosomal peptide synthetase-like protein